MRYLMSLSLLTALSFPVKTQAQNEFKSTPSLKVYFNFYNTLEENYFLQRFPFPNTYSDITKERNFGRITPAVSLSTRKGNMHEVELTQIRFRKITPVTIEPTAFSPLTKSGAEIREESFQVRYEFSYGVLTGDGLKTQVYVGAGSNIFAHNFTNLPRNSATYLTSQFSTGVRLMLIPRITYQLNEKWFLDLNAVVHHLTYRFDHYFVDNPNFTAQQKVHNAHEILVRPTLNHVRFGAGVKI